MYFGQQPRQPGSDGGSLVRVSEKPPNHSSPSQLGAPSGAGVSDSDSDAALPGYTEQSELKHQTQNLH